MPASVPIGDGRTFKSRSSVNLILAQYVKPFVQRSKSKADDAAAVCEATRQAIMPTVAIYREQQQAVQMLHWVRQRLVEARTALISPTRGLRGDYGITFAIHVTAFKKSTRLLLADESKRSLFARILLRDLRTERIDLDEHIGIIDGPVKHLMAEDERRKYLPISVDSQRISPA